MHCRIVECDEVYTEEHNTKAKYMLLKENVLRIKVKCLFFNNPSIAQQFNMISSLYLFYNYCVSF